MTTKGTKRILDSMRKAPSRAAHNLTHNLGIAAKPLNEMTTKEIMDLMSKIYFEPGAMEQIENSLNGRRDSKGPLTRADREVVTQNPVITDLVKEMCVEKALLDESVGTWNSFWEGVQFGKSPFGVKNSQFNKFIDSRDESIKYKLSGRKTFGEFKGDLKAVLDASKNHSVVVMREVDSVIRQADQKASYAKLREKNSEAIDKPTIELIEKMNGSDEHIAQAKNFIEYLSGRIGIDKLVTGPYTYSQLAKITMTSTSRACVQKMSRLQDRRKNSTEYSVGFADDMTQDEKDLVAEAKAQSDKKLTVASKLYKDDLDKGKVPTLKSYAERIDRLIDEETIARSNHYAVVSRVTTEVLSRQQAQRLAESQREHVEFQAAYDEHMDEMNKILNKAGAILATSALEMMEELDDESARNSIKNAAEAVVNGRQGVSPESVMRGDMVAQTTKKVTEVLLGDDKKGEKGEATRTGREEGVKTDTTKDDGGTR